MQKKYLVLTSLISLFTLSNCSGLTPGDLSPTPIPKPSSSTTLSKYQLPFRLTQEQECGTSVLMYEIKADGVFTYRKDNTNTTLQSTPTPPDMNGAMLSDSDRENFITLLNTTDLDTLLQNSEHIPNNAPQTKECRTIENYQMQVNQTGRTFEGFNSRRYRHTQAYNDALVSIKNRLEVLKTKYTNGQPSPSPTQYVYRLPLQLVQKNECTPAIQKSYKLSTDGSFTYSTETESRNRVVPASDITATTNLLNQLDVLKLLEKSEVIPPGSPQTADCREIQTFTFSANGEQHFLEGAGTRKYRHTQEMLNALQKLKVQLESLMPITISTIQSVKNGTSFGFCMGYCKEEMSANATKLTWSKQAQGGRGADTAQYPNMYWERPLTEQEWKSLIEGVDMAKFSALPDQYGCPDCADGGAEWLEISDGQRTKRVTIEYGKALPELEPLLTRTRTLRKQISASPPPQ